MNKKIVTRQYIPSKGLFHRGELLQTMLLLLLKVLHKALLMPSVACVSSKQDDSKTIARQKQDGSMTVLRPVQEPAPNSYMRVLRFAAIMLLLMVAGVSGVKAQVGIDYSGTYYISSNNKGSRGVTTADRFYLCPSTNMYLANQPFVTTKKTNQGTDSKWILNFVETIDGKDYYHVIHVAKDANDVNMYLTYNEEKVSGNDARVRVHLQESLDETEGHEDYNLFYINAGNVDGSVVICPKGDEESYSGNTIRSLNPAKNNVDNYAGNNANSPGSFSGYDGNTINCGGLIGLWLYTDNNSTWFLEDYITRPTIGYDASGNIKITNNVASATVYYTTDGTDPITSATRETGTNETTLASFTDGDIIKAVSKIDDDYSNVATFTAVVHVGISNQYLIQNLERTDFYMIPGDVDKNSNTTVNTTSLFRPTMSWYFSDAGSVGGVQYYYIINGSTGDYLDYISDSKIYMKASSDFDESDGYKFALVQGYSDAEKSNPDGFHIVPKAKISDNTYCIYKGGWTGEGTIANASADAMKGTGSARKPIHKHTRWKFVQPNTLNKTAPFTVTDASTHITKFYKIASVGDNAYYIVPPTGSNTNATASNSTDAAVLKSGTWYFEEAQAATASDWCTYYYIRNAETGKYLYFTKDGTNYTSTPKACLEMRETKTGDEDPFLFTWARTAEENVNYYLVPKKLKDVSLNKNGTLQRNSNTLQSDLRRDAGNYAWTFEDADLFCNNPVFEESEGNIIISCNTNGAEIHYTTDGSDPTPSSTKYTTTLSLPTEGNMVVRAIATVSDGATSTESQSVTMLYKPDIVLKEGENVVDATTYIYNGEAKKPTIGEVSITKGENKVTAITTAYSVTDDSYSSNVNAGVNTASVTLTDTPDDNWYIWNASTTFTINPMALTITADSDTKVYDGTALTKNSYTSTALGTGDAIESVTITGSQTIVGTSDNVPSVAVIKKGETNVTANYNITYANGTLEVTPKALTITANPQSITYGDEPMNNGVTYSDFAEGEDDNNLTGTLAYTYNYEQYGNVGEYVITPSGLSNSNYDITFAPGTLTVNQKEVGLSWSEITSFPYDGLAHVPTASATGTVNGDEIAVTVTGEETNAGNYTATASALTGDKAGNYKLPDAKTQAYTITKVTLTVTANNHSITYGDAPEGNGVSYDGFVNSETAEVLGGTLAYNYSYAQYGDVGNSYTITPSGLTSTNYEFTYHDGTLTVNPKEIGIDWTNTELIYNGIAQAPTATATGLVNSDEINVTVTGSETNAGNHTATASELTGDKKDNYSLPEGLTQTFTIAPKSIGDGNRTADDITIVLNEDGTLNTVTDGETTLVENIDYTHSVEETSADKIVTVTGIGNYTDSAKGIYANPTFTKPTGASQAAAVYKASRDLANPTGIKPYIVRKVNPTIGTMTITPLDYIPEDVPVLLLSDAEATGFVASPKDESTPEITDGTKNSNLLKVAPTGGVEVKAAQIYTFYNGEFVLTKAGTLSAGKFYLYNPNYAASSTSASPAQSRSILQFVIEDDATEIDDVRSKMEDVRGDWHTLDGRRLRGNPTKSGIYILKGQKIYIKRK